MTPARFIACLDLLGWSYAALSRQLGDQWNDRTIRRWASGAFRVPPEVAEWLERRTRDAQAAPFPTRRHRRQMTRPTTDCN